MDPKVSVIKTGIAFTKNALLHKLQGIKESSVLVGIPADKSIRKEDEMNNPTLAFLMTHGSQINKIPPRPFLEPGIKKARQLIAKNLGLAAREYLIGDAEKSKEYLKRAGIVGSNSVKRYIGDSNNFAPNAPSTIKQKGSDKPLIDTAQMLRSITSIVVKSTTPVEKIEKKQEVSSYNIGSVNKKVTTLSFPLKNMTEATVEEIVDVGIEL